MPPAGLSRRQAAFVSKHSRHAHRASASSGNPNMPCRAPRLCVMLKHPRRGDAKQGLPSKVIVALLGWAITLPAASSATPMCDRQPFPPPDTSDLRQREMPDETRALQGPVFAPSPHTTLLDTIDGQCPFV